MSAFPVIQNASERPLFGGGTPTMPNLRDTSLDWFTILQFVKIVKLTVDFQIQEKELPITLSGVWTPLGSRKLAIKPEGQRSWIWKQLVTTSDAELAPDDVVRAQDGLTYRVMESTKWENNGLVEYHLVQNYTGRTTA